MNRTLLFASLVPALLALAAVGCGGPSFTSPGQMVLDGQSVVLTAGNEARTAGMLIRTNPGDRSFTVIAGGTPDSNVGQVLAADADRFYFQTFATTSEEAGTISSIPRAGGAPTKLADTIGRAAAIAVDATRVYWAQTFSDHESVLAAPITGGKPVVLAESQGSINGIAVDQDHVYWTLSPWDLGHGVIANVWSVPLSGGAPTPLVSGQQVPGEIVVDGGTLFWLETDFTVDCSPAGRLFSLPAGGGTPAALAKNLPGPMHLTVSADAVYVSSFGWGCNTDFQPGTVTKVPRAGGAAISLASEPDPGAIVVDGSSVYVTTTSGDNLTGAVLALGN